MDKPHFKIDDVVKASYLVNDTTEYVVEGIVQVRYGNFYHLQSRTNLAINIHNVEEEKLIIAE